MRTSTGYRFLMMGLRAAIALAMTAGLTKAQQPPRVPSESDVYCSGMATDQPIPNETYVISGENSRYKNAFRQGDYVYINRGADQGVRVGDVFEVVRPTSDPLKTKWFPMQKVKLKALPCG